MAFVKAHGLELTGPATGGGAGDSSYGHIKNFVVESFANAAAVTPTRAARAWYNEDTDRWEMSVDNGSGSIIKKTFSNKEEVDAYIALVLSQSAGEGSANVGYDGSGAQTNGLFSLAAAQVDATLDSLALQVDQNMKDVDDLTDGYLDLAGTNVMTGALDMGDSKITNLANGTDAQDAVTKYQLDSVQTGLDTKLSCRVATEADLTATYDNGAGTLTAQSNSHLTIDDVSMDIGNRVLVMAQTNAYENGIYEVTAAGSGGVAAEVTEVTMVDDVSASLSGRFFEINDPTTEYYVWFDVDNTSTNPNTAGKPLDGTTKTGIVVDISADDSAAVIAAAVETAVGAMGDFSAANVGDVVTITNANNGVVVDASDAENSEYAPGFSYNVTTQGDIAAEQFILTRTSDADNSPDVGEVTSGMFTFIEEGTSNADHGYQLITNEVVTLGVTDLVFTRFTGADSFIADHGLQKSGNEIDVKIADFIDTTQGLKSDGAGGGLASKIQVDLTTAQWTGEDNSAGNNKFSIAATNVDSALDTIVDKIDQDLTDFESQTATQGSAKVGYDGATGTNTLASLGAMQVDAALDSLVEQLDSEMKNQDDYEAKVLSQTSTEGSAVVGYDGQAAASGNFSLGTSQVDAALDSLALGLDAEMQNQDDYEASLLSQTATEGSALVGYDGQAAANGLFSLAASQTDAALDSLAVALDAEMKNQDDYEALVASQVDGEGSANVGYDGSTGTNTLMSVAAGTVEATLDAIIQAIDDDRQGTAGDSGASDIGWEGEVGDNGKFSIAATNVGSALDTLVDGLDAEMHETDTFRANLLSETDGEGAVNVGYDGSTGANTLASVAAGKVDAALDSLVTQLDAEMLNQDTYEARLLSQVATDGSAAVGYDGQAATSGNFSLAASQVDAALDSLALALDSGGQDLIDHVTVTASQTAGEGSALTGYDGNTGVNGLHSLGAGSVATALDNLNTGLDAEMKNQDDYEASVLSQTATEGGALVGYDGQAAASGNFSLAASQVDAALDSLTLGLDAEMQNQDDYEALLASQTDGEGSANIGYDGKSGSNTQFVVGAGTVEATLDTIIAQIDTNMEDRSSTTDSFNALSAVGTSAAAFTHTINHALATTDILYNVWVDQAGSYVNDIVAVTNTDANNIVVELTEEKAIKWAVFSMEDIS
jgi:hypothetical protein